MATLTPVQIELAGPCSNIYCPFCGVASQGKSEDAMYEPCAHLRFIWIDELPGFSILATDLQESLGIDLSDEESQGLGAEEESEDEISDTEQPLKKVMEACATGSAVCLKVIESGIACGPWSSAWYFCFDVAGAPSDSDESTRTTPQ